MASSYSAVVSADKLPKLTHDNFVTWKMYITAALQERELWGYVGGVPLVQPPSMPATASTDMGPGDVTPDPDDVDQCIPVHTKSGNDHDIGEREVLVR